MDSVFGGIDMGKREKYYIAVNTGEKYPLLKDTLTYTEYFVEAMVFNDIIAVFTFYLECGIYMTAAVG
jgi:hypothetical protein